MAAYLGGFEINKQKAINALKERNYIIEYDNNNVLHIRKKEME